jgi:hypothetical protein
VTSGVILWIVRAQKICSKGAQRKGKMPGGCCWPPTSSLLLLVNS